MKWFRRIFGTPTRDELAEILIEAHRRAGAEGAIEYDAGLFQLRLETGSGERILKNLHNAHNVYAAARPWTRRAVLRRFAAMPWEIPPAATWEEAAPKLRPGLRDTYLFESVRLQARLEGWGNVENAWRSFAGRICVALIEDHQEHMRSVSAGSLETWGVSFDEAMATAIANLEAASRPRRWTNPFPGVHVSAWQDEYDASRLLLEDILSGLELHGVPVALVPNRNCLILTNSESDDAVGHALALAESQSQSPGAISVIPLRQTPSGWVPWEIGEQHPSRETFRRLRLEEVGGLYEDQKRLLDTIHEKEDIDIFVGSFSASQNEETGEVRSYCVWTRGVLALLPRTDQIAFCDMDLPEEQQILGLFDWDKVEARCGHLMQKTGDVLPRYRIEQEGFPSAEDFAAMGPPAA